MDGPVPIQDLKRRLAETSTDAARLAVLRDLENRSAELPRDEVEAYAREAVELARKTGSYKDLVRAAIALSDICQDAGDADIWMECADIVREAARASGDPAHEGQYLYLMGRAHEVQGSYELARDYFERSLEAFRNTAYTDCIGAALNQLANLAVLRGQAAEALDYYQECLKLDDDLDDIANGALHQFNVGEALQRLGRLDDAHESYYRVLALSEQHPEVRHMRPVALSALGELSLERDKPAKAIGIFKMVMAAVERDEAPPFTQADTTASLGLAYHRRGNHASAQQAYAQALTLAEESGNRREAAIVLSHMAELALEMEQFDRCRESAERSAAVAREVGLPCEEASALRVMALLHAARAEDSQARDCFQRALALLGDLEDSLDLARVRFHYGRYLLARGEREAAAANLKAAARTFRRLGIVAEGHEVNRLLFREEMGLDRDAALLRAISGLVSLGVGPQVLLEHALGLLLEALRYESAAILARGRPVLVQGKPTLERFLGSDAGQGLVATDLTLSWPVRCGGSEQGRICLERSTPAATEQSHLVLETVADLLALPIQRLAELVVGMVEERPGLAGLRYQGVVGQNQRMLEVLTTVCSVAGGSDPVLIHGESGTGKELVARALHDSGARAAKPFLAVNCAGVHEALLEVELFGAENGGEDRGKPYQGKFEKADGGTVLLDEIGDLGPNLQAKLLRVLQERTFERVGGRVPISVDVRVVAATTQPIAELVAHRRFREDLYGRLKTVELLLPPLHERAEDIPHLVRHFVRRSSQEFKRHVADVSPEVMELLAARRWPGNVRELEYVVERAVVLARGDTVQLGDLPPSLLSQTSAGSESGAVGL